MVNLWSVQGDNLDVGYANLCAAVHEVEREMKAAIDALWTTYEPFADPDFPQGFARDPDARFWEMYLGVRLLEAGKQLLPTAERLRAGGQPDICVLDGDRRIWIEAIAPSPGDPGPDQVVGPVPINEGGGLGVMPKRQAQLRTTSALWTKSRAIVRYLEEGVIAAPDVRLVAISACRFGLYAEERPLPLIMSSVFPIGDAFVTIDAGNGEVVNQGFHPSLRIQRAGGEIPRTAFLTDQFEHVSGVVWSRLSIGNMSRQERPLTLVHNPRAAVQLPERWGVWDREFVTVPEDGHWLATDILQPVDEATLQNR